MNEWIVRGRDITVGGGGGGGVTGNFSSVWRAKEQLIVAKVLELRAQHVKFVDDEGLGPIDRRSVIDRCERCWDVWPCPAAKALDAVLEVIL